VVSHVPARRCVTWVRLRCSPSSGHFVEVITIDLRDLQRSMRDPDPLTDQTQSLLFDHAPAALPRPRR